MATSAIKIRIGTEGVEASASKIEQFNRKVSSSFDSIKKKWLEIGTAALALKKAFDFSEQAAVFDQQAQAFANLAGSYNQDSNRIIADLKRMSDYTVSTADIMKQAGTAMTLKIPAENLNKMMEISRASAKIMGETTADMFEKLTVGLARQSKLRLDDLGIIIDVAKANKEYAKTLGIVGRELTDTEKKQAFLNSAMESGQDIIDRVGKSVMTAADAIQMFKAGWEDVKIFIGKIFISITAGLSGLGFSISKVFAQVLYTGSYVFAKLEEYLSFGGKNPFYKATPGVIEFAEQQKAAATEAGRLADQSFAVAKSIWKQKEAMEGVNRARKDMTGETGDPAKEAKEYQKYLKSALSEELKIWQGYYSLLSKEHEKAAHDRLKWENLEKEIKKESTDLFKLINDTFDPAPALDEFQQFWNQVDAMDAQATAAMQLEGEEKVKALRKVRLQLAELPQGIKDGKDEIVSSLEVFDMVKIRYTEWSDAIKQTVVEEKEAAASREDILKTAMEKAEEIVESLQEQMKNLTMEIDNKQAMAAIDEVDLHLASIPPVTKKYIQIETISGNTAKPISSLNSTGSSGSFSPPSFDLGIKSSFSPSGSTTDNSKKTELYIAEGAIVVNESKSGQSSAKEIMYSLKELSYQLGG